jgi:hypothetical protein
LKSAPFLQAMDTVVGRIKIQDQLRGRLREAGDELLDETRDIAAAVARSARFSNRHKVGLLASSSLRSTALCHARSLRKVS